MLTIEARNTTRGTQYRRDTLIDDIKDTIEHATPVKCYCCNKKMTTNRAVNINGNINVGSAFDLNQQMDYWKWKI